MSTSTDLNTKQERIVEHLRARVAEQTYFKSRFIGRELGLSAKEVGTNMPAIADDDDQIDLNVERWGGFSSATTWKVTTAGSETASN